MFEMKELIHQTISDDHHYIVSKVIGWLEDRGYDFTDEHHLNSPINGYEMIAIENLEHTLCELDERLK